MKITEGMRKRLIIAIGALAIGLLAFVCALSYHRQKPVAKLQYVGSGQVNVQGQIYSGSTFSVSNCSANSIIVILRAIENKTAQEWCVYTNATRMLLMLPPHKAGNFSIDSPTIDGAWRIRVQACSQMKGLGAYWSFGKLYWGDLRYRLRFGRAARPWPSSKNPIYDLTAELVSQEVIE